MVPSSRWSLRAQLLLILVLLPVLALALAYWRAKERNAQAVERVRDDVRELADDLAQEHAAVMREARDLLIVLAAVPALREPQSCERLVAPLVEHFPQYANIGVVEADGRVRCNARGIVSPELSLADRPYIQEARRTGTFATSEYQVGRITGLPIVTVAYPIEGGDGLVWVSIDLASLGDALARAEFPVGTQFLLTDPNGLVIATHPEAPDRIGRPAEELAFIAALPSDGANVVEARDRHGVDRVVARASLGNTGVNGTAEVLVALPADETFAPARQQLARDLAMVGFFALFGIFLATLADRRFFRPIDRVAVAARRIGSGDLGARSGVALGTGPAKALATAFDDMAVAVEEKARQERHQSTHDPLTGLPNRAALREHLAGELADRRSVAVALVIVDRFHDIVNTLGHPTGDLLLRQIGPRLREAVGADVLVARVGGGEFAAALPCVGPDDPALVTTARKMHDAMMPPFMAGDLQVEPGGSVGVVCVAGDEVDPDRLIQHAGVAAMAARRTGSEVEVYSPAIDPWTSRRLRLMGGLRSGLRNHEMAVVYQPKVELRTGLPAGAETLVRWHHPEFETVSPLEFIGLAEQTGAIRPLTRWVVEQAAECSRRLSEAGFRVRISANISARDLTDPGFAKQIADILVTTGARPANLELEVTESLLLSDPVLARRTLEELRAIGLALSIDDFGTGYSSLAYLRDLPVNIIKIDKSFISGGTGPLKDAAITRSIVELGHNLGLEVLAEGVSTAVIEAALREMGCDVAQGMLYGRPMTEAAFSDWLRRASVPEGA